jgi:hypothetical protein
MCVFVIHHEFLYTNCEEKLTQMEYNIFMHKSLPKSTRSIRILPMSFLAGIH